MSSATPAADLDKGFFGEDLEVMSTGIFLGAADEVEAREVEDGVVVAGVVQAGVV